MLRTIPVFRCAPYLFATIWLIGLSAADEAAEQRRKPLSELKIVTAYTPGQMPAPEQLLARYFKIFAEAESWTADFQLRTGPIDSVERRFYHGTLLAKGQRMRAEVYCDSPDDGTQWLLVVDQHGVAWSESRSPDRIHVEKETLSKHVKPTWASGTIGPLPNLGPLSGSSQLLAEINENFDLDNKGIADLNDAKVYVLEAVLKDETVLGQAPNGIQARRFLITLNAANALPGRIICLSSGGESKALELKSLRFNLEIDDTKFAYEPPDAALVVDKDTLDPLTKLLKNPTAYSPQSIARGKSLYQADCVVCHSIDGTGRDSDVTDNAADLTDTKYWLSDGSNEATFLAIRDGAGEEMPGYQDEYRDEKVIWDLVNYIRSLQNHR